MYCDDPELLPRLEQILIAYESNLNIEGKSEFNYNDKKKYLDGKM